MIRSIFTFSLSNGIVEIIKFGLVCCPSLKLLSLFNLKPYGFLDKKLDNMLIIPEISEENLLTISSLQLIPSVRAMDNFYITLVELPES